MGIFTKRIEKKERTRNAVWWRQAVRKERLEAMDSLAKRVGVTRAELFDLLLVGGMVDLASAKGKERAYLQELRRARLDFGLDLGPENQGNC